ncbi:MAG TPA: serine/threonine-protein kinase [Burkholderiales bacterium]|nr:serine/threonine-protein kinase [Burkholderiales bacterium]
MATNALPAGYALQEYRIEKVLGVGGFGLTYLALDGNLNLKVAVKEYLPDDVATRGADQSISPRSPDNAEHFGWGKQRFLDESRVVASFRHPNIVRVMRFFEANGTAYMVMEFVEGAALNDWIRTRRPLAQPQLASIVGPLLDGLEVVHKAGFLHRDIKPGNIYIREDGTPVLLDFGAARMRTGDLTTIVSPGFAPFEQYHNKGNQGPWSDLYALGGVLYWMITGNKPHEAAARIKADTMPSALQSADRALYRPEFLAAIDWALAPNEDERPQSVAEWRESIAGSGLANTTRTVPALNAVPSKSTLTFDPALLKKLETALAQHLGPIAPVVVRNAAKQATDQADLVQRVAQEIAEEPAKAAFEKKFSDISRPASQPASATRSNPPTALAAARFPLEVLARAEDRLAEYIGAVARVVVKRAAMKARDEAELYLLLADEIEDKEDRKAFARKAVSMSRKP